MRRIFTFDIEVDWDKKEAFSLVITKGNAPIQMIGCFDFFKQKFYSFFYHKDVKLIDYSTKNINKINKKHYELLKKFFKEKNFNVIEGKFNSSESKITWDCRYLDFNDERKMMTAFMKVVKELSPDIYNGFFIRTFDLVYIINRCKSLSVSSSYLSCLRNVYISNGEAYITGSVIYDIPDTYANFMGSHRHANSLKKLAETHLKRDDAHKITKTSDSIIDETWYDDDWDKFKEYCLIDVELCVLLEKQLGLINMCDKFEKFTGVNPRFVMNHSSVIESFFNMIKPLYEEKVLHNEYRIAFQTKSHKDMRKESGGLVLESIRGLYKSGLMLILDLSKEYPKIIETLNISIETLVEEVIKEEEKKNYIHCLTNDKYYQKEPIGFVPFALKILYKIRDQIEEERDRFEYGTKEWKEMNDKRQTVKDVINAVSGQFDYVNSIIAKEGIADSIRGTGRTEIIISNDYTIKFSDICDVDLQVIYGDTDSVFVWLKNVEDWKIGKKVADEIVKWIQKGFDIFAKKMNVDSHKFEISLEKILDVFLSTGKKKKYFGHVLWADGKEVSEENSFYIRGFESRRSDSSEFTDKVQKEIFGLICQTKRRKGGWNEVRNEIIRKIRIDYPSEFNEENFLEIGIPRKLKMPFDKYKVTNPHLEGCNYANKYLNANFSAGSKPKLIYLDYVKDNKQGFPNTKHLSVEEGMTIPEGIFVVDKRKMMEKTIRSKLRKTLDVVGIDDNEIDTGYKKKTIFDFFNKSKEDNMIMVDENNIDKILEISNERLEEIKYETQ